MDLKIDDLLEKVSRLLPRSSVGTDTLYLIQQKDGVALLDLEYVSLSVTRVLALLNKSVSSPPPLSSGILMSALVGRSNDANDPFLLSSLAGPN